jgi:hypothetical protein
MNFLSQQYFSDDHPNSQNLRQQLIKNIIRTTECNINDLENIFFSDANIDLINKQLILAVWKQSNKQYKIEFQDKNKLIIIMRYVFIEYAKNLPYDLKKQITELNCIMVGIMLPDIITNFEQKIGYLKYIENRAPLLDLPKSTKNRISY